MSKIKIVSVKDPRYDPRYDYLCNDSKHGFYEPENIWWPTVTHFLEAKKFEGTQYENIIRTSKTTFQAKRLTREREKLVILPTLQRDSYIFSKKKVYGSRKIDCVMKSDWEKNKINFLRIALYKKFDQHPRLLKKLIDTHPQKIESVDENHTAEILQEIREKYLNEYIE